jgi:hypothetical protein
MPRPLGLVKAVVVVVTIEATVTERKGGETNIIV